MNPSVKQAFIREHPLGMLWGIDDWWVSSHLIYIAPYTIQIVSKQLYSVKQEKGVLILQVGLGIVWVFFDTGAKSILLKRYRFLNGA